jgi:hypothetical protein
MRARSVLLIAAALAGVGGCGNAGPEDTATLEKVASHTILHVTILGSAADPRVQPIGEAVSFWNGELEQLGSSLRLELDSVESNFISDSLLRAGSRQAVRGRGSAITGLRRNLSGIKGDVVIALSQTDLISYGLPWHRATKGIVALRRSDIPPLSLPNTLRNVTAHELGHVLGLRHNDDVASLMCGRPAPCRPAAFASDSAHFFPLTTIDKNRLRKRWP